MATDAWWRQLRALAAVGRGGQGRAGQAIVEMAVIGMLLATMALGVFEIGRAYRAYLSVIQGARDGARVAILQGENHNWTAIQNAATASAAPYTVSVSTAHDPPYGSVRVTVTHAFNTPVPLVSEIWGGGPLTLRYAASGRTN